MSVQVIAVKKFNEKIEMYIPFHKVSSLPRIGDVEGKSFECGCGESHIMNFDQHFYIADGGIFKDVFLSVLRGRVIRSLVLVDPSLVIYIKTKSATFSFSIAVSFSSTLVIVFRSTFGTTFVEFMLIDR